MVKAKAGNTIFFGLSDVNLEKLKEGKPIKFNLNELGLQDIDVVIFHGKTEEEMYQMFKETINPFKTILKDSNAKNN